MQKKLQQLTELQTIDTQLAQIEKAKGNLPYLVNEFKKIVDDTNLEISELNENISSVKKEILDSKTQIEESEKLMEKYKTQRSMVTNNKEYEALVNEMAYRENLIEELTTKIAELNTEKENKDSVLSEKNDFLENKKKNLEDNEKLLKEKLAETADEENQLTEKRNKLVAKIDKHLYNLYVRIYRSKNQAAVVPADGGHCGGCYTMLPSQKLSELKRGDSIVQCDTCSRILIFSFDQDKK